MRLTDPAVRIPSGLRTAELTLRPITADDAPDDHAALMETRDDLRLWEQSSWPADDFTVAANREDLAGLERRHREHKAFTYTVRDPGDSECLGCVYVFDTRATFLAESTVTALGDAAWEDVEAVVFFWVRRSRMADGLDARLLAALRAWFAEEWAVERTVFVASEPFAQQVGLLEGAGLVRRFEYVEPGKPGRFLAYS
ncbi:N-acetyltransferase [Leifsonia sp. NPDC056824]|uniref:N-acetyltransferase n=1 Tax=Leifsonia sp. NPDC056824 TaxID=3345953 RepID=UPI00367AFFA4